MLTLIERHGFKFLVAEPSPIVLPPLPAPDVDYVPTKQAKAIRPKSDPKPKKPKCPTIPLSDEAMKTLDEKIEEMRAKINPSWRTHLELCETIQAAAIAVFGVAKESFFNGERTRTVADARMASMVICRERTRLSLNEIGKIHGGRDHGTVLHAIKTVKRVKGELQDGLNEIRRIIDNLPTS